MKHLQFFLCFLAFLALFSCEQKEILNKKKGEIVFSFQDKSMTLKSALLDANAEPSAITISVEDLDGNKIYSLEKIQLVKFNNDFISEPFELKEGNYKVTAFFVLDKDGNAIYAAPLKDSEKAYLVKKPLPIEFNVENDKVTKLVPEVLSTNNQTAASFGYLTLGFQVVETFTINTSVFIYNTELKNFELTSAELEISNESINYNYSLSAKTNQLIVKDGFSNYKLVFKKDGYTSQTFNFTATELKANAGNPIKVLFLNKTSVVLQPGNELKDAVLSMIISDANRGDGMFGALYSWTQEGILNTTRTLIEYDLSMIPQNQIIKSAKIYLSYYNVDGYATSGETSFYVKKITSEWNEMSVTWNTAPSMSDLGKLSFSTIPETTNVLELNVTTLIQDQISHPESNHGLCFMLQNESAYRRFCWYSSDASVSDKRPKLVIEY